LIKKNKYKEMIEYIKNLLGFNKKKVMILDDIEYNVELISNYLEDINCIKTYKMYNPLNAEKLLKKIKFDLLIFDIQMPEIDGYELVMRIKNDEYNINKNTPIIFITGIYDSDLDKMKGFNIGSIDYIIKPIEYKSFMYKVKKYLNIGNDDNLFFDIKRYNIKNTIDL
jgi:PleD family two-component response regulator